MKATLVIENITNLATMSGSDGPRKNKAQKDIGLIKNGVIAISKDKIIYVGEGKLPESIPTDEDTVFIDATGKLVTPGLIDPHTHLVHGGSRENEFSMKLEGKSYLEILSSGGGIHSTAKATKEATFEELYDKAYKSLNIMLEFGVTTVEAKSGYGIGDFETELKQIEVARKLDETHPIDVVPTFMGAHAVPPEYKGRSDIFVDKIVNEMIPYIAQNKLAEFCDVFCEEGVFTIEQSRKILLSAKSHGLIPKIHADEIVSIGGAELASEIECISAEHLISASKNGIKKMGEKNVIAVLLPGTSFNLQEGKVADARYMIDNDVAVAIATDYNPGSCPSENLQLMMSFASITLKMTPEEVLTASTINAACAIKRESSIGSIEVGKIADIAIFDVPNLAYMIYHFGINHTDSVIKKGKIVYKKNRRVLNVR